LILHILSLSCSHYRPLHHFPTRRSSDLEMNNLQDSEVSNFSVKGFNFNPVWDSDQSLEEKEEYYGIIRDGDDAELVWGMGEHGEDRKSTRLNSSHVSSSYAVFCLKKQKS